ncbi:MAG: hypothetical protein ACYTG5_16205 [Planctomycetota bacterium]|jgi:hypothetical protein
MIGIALALAIETTSDLTWPPKDDFYREMGATQSILDGYSQADPAYLGESRWYTPLVAQLVAWIAPITELSLPTFYTRAGPYFNLLVPLAFYLMVSVMFGRWAAVASLGVFLFVVSPFLPPRVLGTYSPWLWTRNFTQGLFFVSAAAAFLAFRSGKQRWALVGGALLGLTFLGHVAPAIILVLFVLCLWGAQILLPDSPGESRWRPASLSLLLIGGVSLLVSSQFLLPILVEYGFHMKNKAPAHHIALGGWEMLVGLVSVRTGLALVGVCLLLRPPAAFQVNRKARNALMILISASLLPLVYGVLVRQAAQRGIELRQFVPAFHFHIYFTALQAVFAGLALCYLARQMVPVMTSFLEARRIAPNFRGGLVMERLVLLLLMGLFLGGGFGSYLASADMRQFRQDSIQHAQRSEITELYDWVLKNTKSEDVFLTDPMIGFYAISSAGRKVIVQPENYSNPYVDYSVRREAGDKMYEFLRSGDVSAFLKLGAEYGVGFVVAATDVKESFRLEAINSQNMKEVFRHEDVIVYQVSQ